jgi:exodeoxyribonuclease VIII
MKPVSMIEKKLDFREYRGKTQYISASELKAFIDSPYSYYKRYILKEQDTEPKASALLFGSLVHCLLLEPHEFDKAYYVTDVRKDARTKAYQEELERAAGRECISSADLDRARECADAGRAQLAALGAMTPELSYFYEGSRGFLGLKVKARFDAWLDDEMAILDIKTSNKLPTYDTVVRTVLTLNYDVQAAWYMDIHKCVTGRMPRAFYFLFVQSEFPYGAALYKMDKEFIDFGRGKYRKHLAELRNALRSLDLDSGLAFPRMRRQKEVLHLPSWIKREGIKEAKIETGENNGI